VEIELADTHRIFLQVRVELTLHIAAQWFINENTEHKGDSDEPRNPSNEPNPPFSPYQLSLSTPRSSPLEPFRRIPRGAAALETYIIWM
jgi:hypothetical protein